MGQVLNWIGHSWGYMLISKHPFILLGYLDMFHSFSKKSTFSLKIVFMILEQESLPTRYGLNSIHYCFSGRNWTIMTKFIKRTFALCIYWLKKNGSVFLSQSSIFWRWELIRTGSIIWCYIVYLHWITNMVAMIFKVRKHDTISRLIFTWDMTLKVLPWPCKCRKIGCHLRFVVSKRRFKICPFPIFFRQSNLKRAV